MCAIVLGSLILPRAARADDAPPASDVGDSGYVVDVRGSLLDRDDDDPTLPSASLDRAALSAPGASLADLLGRLPSVDVARSGGASDLATATLRGATSAETPVYLGPILLNDELTGTADLSTVSPSFLGRATVYRGHAPIELPASGLGGAIVLTPLVPFGARVGAGAELGSFGQRAVFAGASFGDERAAAALSVRFDATDGDFAYIDDRGTRFDPSDDREVLRDNADARSVDAWSTAHVALGDRGALDLVARVFRREQGVPGLGVLPATRARATTEKAIAAASSSVGCREPSSPCRVFVSVSGKSSSYLLDDPRGELLFSARRQRTSARGGAVALGFEDGGERVLARGGASLGLDDLVVDPIGPDESHARRLKLRAYAGLTARPVDAIELHAEGAIEDDVVSQGSANEPAATLSTARVGLAASPIAELGLFLSAGRYARVPTLGERFGVSASVLGNAALAVESGFSLDAGAKSELARGPLRLSAELDLFARFAADLIAYQRSSFGALRPFNLGSARVLGLEALCAARLWDALDLSATLTLTDPRDTSDGLTTQSVIPFESTVVFSPRAGFELRELVRALRLDRLGAGSTFLYRSPRVADPAGLASLPSQVAWDVDAFVAFDRDRVVVRARVSNLLGDRSTDLVGYPLPGRAGHLSFEDWW